MLATSYEIVDKLRERPFQLTDISDFRLREKGQIPAEEILEYPTITLYSLDFENSRAVFVETPPEVDLSQAPFYFITQFEKAERVLTISFETMIGLAKSISVDDKRLIFIQSAGRSGSTLASQIFAQIPGVINISEPDALTLLVTARNSNSYNEDDLVALLRAAICLLCKTETERAWVIKGRSYVIGLVDWLYELFPQSRNLFLYRHAETWLRSFLSSFGDSVELSNEERRGMELQRRELMGSLVPSIAEFDANHYLSHAAVLSLVWLWIMERYVRFYEMGVEMLAIRFASWRSNPRKTAEAMLDYCGCRPADMTAVYEALNRDSQAGTGLSQDSIDQRGRGIIKLDLEDLNWHLENHAFIHEADFELANTLKV